MADGALAYGIGEVVAQRPRADAAEERRRPSALRGSSHGPCFHSGSARHPGDPRCREISAVQQQELQRIRKAAALAAHVGGA